MCGRYSQTLTAKQIEQAFGPLKIDQAITKNYNVAPTQKVPVITARDQQERQLELFEWGLVPHWSKDGRNTGRMINARSETVLEKPSFRTAVRRNRCLIPADSFYEWKRQGNIKQPVRIQLTDKTPLSLAGIYSFWQDKEDPSRQKLTFSILTTEPNREMASVHNRMPVIMYDDSMREAWLGNLTDDDITALTQTPPDGLLSYYEVSTEVNNVRNNGAQLHEPAQNDTLFGD